MQKTLGAQYTLKLRQHWDKTELEIARAYLGDQAMPVDTERIRDLIIWLWTEISVVSHFCSSCDRIALPVPGFSDALGAIDIKDDVNFFTEGRTIVRQTTPYFELGGVFAFAQHYGVPTRLLDFSDSPPKATYFAVAQATTSKHFCIWVLRHFEEQGVTVIPTQEFRALRSQIPLLHAQDGLFFACNVASNRYFLERGKWPTLDQMLVGWSIEKIICPAEIRSDVKQRLAKLGITDLTMMPSYESVARDVRATYLKLGLH
jgi:hypothetical protein